MITNIKISEYEGSAYCMRCQDIVPASFVCNRGPRYDNGPGQAEVIKARYEGICLRCCNHNHG